MDELTSPWATALRRRLRQPVQWAAFAAITLPYLAYQVWFARAMEPLPNAWGWTHRLLTPTLLFFGWVWLSPLPWEWAWRPGRSRSALRGALAAACFSEAFVLLRSLPGLWLKWKAGEPLETLETLLVNLAFLGPIMMLAGAALAHRELSEREKHHFRAQAEAAHLRLLQSQLHPHVLFNALNGLAELVERDPAAAGRGLRALSDLLRKLLEAGQATWLPLGAERALVEDYLAVEALRLGDRLRLDWRWSPELDACLAAPLLLQPLVENALKHGIAPHLDGGDLRIEGVRTADALRLTVRNTGAPLGGGTGLGLLNLRARLEGAYGGAATLHVGSEGAWTVAEVRAPWRHPDEAP